MSSNSLHFGKSTAIVLVGAPHPCADRARAKFSHTPGPAPGKPQRRSASRGTAQSGSAVHARAVLTRTGSRAPSPPTAREPAAPSRARPRRPQPPYSPPARSPELTEQSPQPGTWNPQHRTRNAQPDAPSPAPTRGRLAPAPLFKKDYGF